MITINDFKSIKIKEKSLIFLDIDETILYYDGITQKWWENTYNYYKKLLKNYSNNQIKILCIKEWSYIASTCNPCYTDEEGLKNLLKQIEETNSKLIFITARQNNHKHITKQNFKFLNIPYNKYDIYHLSGLPKGTFGKKLLKNNIILNSYKEKIFIDDMQHNIDNMKLEFNNEIICYKFVI